MDIEKMRGAVIAQIRTNREFEERIAKIEEVLKIPAIKPNQAVPFRSTSIVSHEDTLGWPNGKVKVKVKP